MRDPETTTGRARRHFDSSQLWSADRDLRTYRNPIICADYSDPDVVRHGEDFYMVASSFNCTPGLPILHSRDLVHWQLINHAMKNLPDKRYETVQHGCGVWAPAIRHHAGKFWVFFPMPDEGIFMTTAEDPAGEWSTPHVVRHGKGLIDPCPLWDDDGNAYLVHAYAHSRSGIRHRLRVCPMSPDGSDVYGNGEIVYENPTKHPTIEGPKFLKRDGWYYILAPAGGVATGWQVVLRSRDIYGPYEDKIVLEQGDSPVNGPHQGALVDTPEGDWWFVHFQDAGPYGRITHLQPAQWKDGWPLMGVDRDGNGIGEPVLQHRSPRSLEDDSPPSISSSDSFDATNLGLQWQWNANHADNWYSLTEQPGTLRLYARPCETNRLMDAPHLLTQKFPAREFSVTTMLRMPRNAEATKAGLVIAGQTYAALLVSRCDEMLTIEQVESDGLAAEYQEVTNDTDLCNSDHVLLRVVVDENAKCVFSYSTDGLNYLQLGAPFEATPGVWIGARIGLVCVGADAHADFEFIDVREPAPPH